MSKPFSVELPFSFDQYGQFPVYYLERYYGSFRGKVYRMLDPNNKHNIIYFDIEHASCDSYIVTLDVNNKIQITPSWSEDGRVAEAVPTLEFCSDYFATRQQAEAMAEYLCKRFPVPEEVIVYD